jgi:glucose-6-phosphate 1-dehydrogenase
MSPKKTAIPVLITIFGAKGDLTRRKLIPALYNLFTGKHLPPIFTIYCVDFLKTDETAFKNDLLTGINEFSRSGIAEELGWNEFVRSFSISGRFSGS